MSNQPETPLNLRLHINDIQDILASIALDKSADVESVWYEFWDAVLNYWIRRSSDCTLRLSVAPQRQIIREMLSDTIDADLDHNWSFEADPGDTSMDLSGDPPSIQQRIFEAHAGVHTESRIPDFTVFSLRHHGLPHRRLICIIEIKSQADIALALIASAAPQIITQAKFAFDTAPDLRHVFSIFALGDSWCLFQFPRDELTKLYLNSIEGWKDNDQFDPMRAPMRSRNININRFIVIPFSKVLDDNGLDYSTPFKDAIRLITANLKARQIHSFSSNGNAETSSVNCCHTDCELAVLSCRNFPYFYCGGELDNHVHAK
ncbi:hypothetical protein J3R83DRAFT_10136 [Lanmaoa asiatica]|nr:hypothetical protein J3R83DRAFT_10136 [Lanmaoa asiatica]